MYNIDYKDQALLDIAKLKSFIPQSGNPISGLPLVLCFCLHHRYPMEKSVLVALFSHFSCICHFFFVILRPILILYICDILFQEEEQGDISSLLSV